MHFYKVSIIFSILFFSYSYQLLFKFIYIIFTFFFQLLVTIFLAVVTTVESGIVAPAALTAPIAYARFAPQNIPPFAASVSYYGRALKVPALIPAAAPFLATTPSFAASAVGVRSFLPAPLAAPYAAASVAVPLGAPVAAPLAAPLGAPVAAPLAAPLPYASPFGYPYGNPFGNPLAARSIHAVAPAAISPALGAPFVV